MKDVTKSIKIAVFLCVAVVFTLTGCKGEHTGGATTHPPFVKGGEEHQPFPDDIPEMSSKLVGALKESGVEYPTFIITFNEQGDIQVFRTESIGDKGTPSQSVEAKEINRVTSISIVDFKNSPGCVWIEIGGHARLMCEKIN